MASTRKLPQSKTLLARVSALLGRHVGPGARLVAGLSGGVDSVVLLDVLLRLAGKNRFELAVLHVNHQINPAAAGWVQFCRAYCKRQGVTLTVAKVQVRRTSSLEAAARDARYAAFAALPADFVVLAHNLDDQAETVLLQLLRGAGVKGVSAMPELRKDEGGRMKAEGKPLGSSIHPSSFILHPSILRPLLDIPRSEIEAYAVRRKLKWIEDDSNADVRFDRNFLRHRLLPVIEERYPAYRKTLARAGRNFAEAANLMHEFGQNDAQLMGNGLDIAALRQLSAPRAKNAIRVFLAVNGVTMPNAARLAECVRQVQQPRAARLAIDLGACELRRYAGELRIVAKAASPPPALCRLWEGEARLAIPELDAILVMKKCRGSGISLAKLQAAPVVVRLRGGGERMRPNAKRPRRSLKNLMQEAHLPPWLRERLPLLFCGDALVYVPGIGIDSAFSAARGEAGIKPGWEYAARRPRR